MPHEEQQQNVSDFRTSVNFLYFLAKSHCFCLWPFMRHSFGIHMPGFLGLFAMFIIIGQFMATRDLVMMQYLCVWFVLLIFHRIRGTFLWYRGQREHSEYDGWPWLAMRVPFTKNEVHAKNAEPNLCLILGAVLVLFSPALGSFVAFGFISMLIVRATNLEVQRRQVVAMHDLQLEQQAIAERMRRF